MSVTVGKENQFYMLQTNSFWIRPRILFRFQHRKQKNEEMARTDGKRGWGEEKEQDSSYDTLPKAGSLTSGFLCYIN